MLYILSTCPVIYLCIILVFIRFINLPFFALYCLSAISWFCIVCVWFRNCFVSQLFLQAVINTIALEFLLLLKPRAIKNGSLLIDLNWILGKVAAFVSSCRIFSNSHCHSPTALSLGRHALHVSSCQPIEQVCWLILHVAFITCTMHFFFIRNWLFLRLYFFLNSIYNVFKGHTFEVPHWDQCTSINYQKSPMFL